MSITRFSRSAAAVVALAAIMWTYGVPQTVFDAAHLAPRDPVMEWMDRR
jgi:hypothetical protein